jgi:hypothetical protein
MDVLSLNNVVGKSMNSPTTNHRATTNETYPTPDISYQRDNIALKKEGNKLSICKYCIFVM